MSDPSTSDAGGDVRCSVCGSESRHLLDKHGYEVRRCRGCGLGFVANLPTPAELEQFYASAYYHSDHAWGYSAEYRSLEAGLKKMYRSFVRRIERQRGSRPVARVLDVGCAYGFFLDVAGAAWQPQELVGVDVTEEAERANRDKGHQFHRGLLEDVELPASHFDVVFLGDSFEHVRDPQSVAARLARALAPGGTLLLTTVDFDAWLPRLFGRHWRLMAPPEHLHFWNRRSLLRIFADHGLAGRTEGYWIHYPKDYVVSRFRTQFGFPPFFLALFPGNLIPIPSVDVLLGLFEKRA